MSYDYFLECSICKQEIRCFSNIDRDPQFFDVLKFLMEHKWQHKGKAIFTILDQDQSLDKYVKIQCGDIPKIIEFELDVKCLDDIIEMSVKYDDGSGYTYNPNKEIE